MCDFNRVIHLGADGTLLEDIRSYYFNDLHAITQTDNSSFLVANTGLDRIERLSFDFSIVNSFDALTVFEKEERLTGQDSERGSYYDKPDVEFYRRRLADKLHINYALALPDGRTVASSLTECCYLDGRCFSPISDRLQYPPHDGLVYEENLWITTVDGKILAAKLAPILEFKLVLNLALIAPWQGWCRGLYIQDGLMYIGITAIAKRSGRTRWLSVDPAQTRTGVYEICLVSLQILHFYDLSHADGARVFSMTEFVF